MGEQQKAATKGSRKTLEMARKTWKFIRQDYGEGHEHKNAGKPVVWSCALVEKGGVDRQAFVDLLSNTLFDCPVYKIYGDGIAQNVYRPAGMRLVLGLKDIELVLDAAHRMGVAMPLGSLVRDRLIRAVTGGHGEDDWMAADVVAREDAGLTS